MRIKQIYEQTIHDKEIQHSKYLELIDEIS